MKFAEVCRELFSGSILPVRSELAARNTQKIWTSELGTRRVGVLGAPLPKIIPAELPDFSRMRCPTIFTPTPISRIASSMSRRRAAVRSPANFACHRWTFPCAPCRWKNFSAKCKSCWIAGFKQFKFVDRTFNLNIATSKAILEFFLARHQPGNFYHFEMIPDRLPAELREVIAQFPPGALQFEVGIQTFNPEVGSLISRRQNYERLGGQF